MQQAYDDGDQQHATLSHFFPHSRTQGQPQQPHDRTAEAEHNYYEIEFDRSRGPLGFSFQDMGAEDDSHSTWVMVTEVSASIGLA